MAVVCAMSRGGTLGIEGAVARDWGGMSWGVWERIRELLKTCGWD